MSINQNGSVREASVKILWVFNAGVRDAAAVQRHLDALNLDFLLTHPQASNRLRVFIPAAEIASASHQIGFRALSSASPDEDLVLGDAPDVAVIAKVKFEPDGVLFAKYMQLIHDIRGRGARLIIDHCDDHIGRGGPAADMYRTFLGAADVVTVNSPVMKEVLTHQNAGSDIRVVLDPVEGNRQPPAFAPAVRYRRCGTATVSTSVRSRRCCRSSASGRNRRRWP